MTVIPFPSVRFTDDDLAVFERIASPMLKRGLWATVRRETTPGHDRMIVQIPDVAKPLFTFERARGGRYRLLLHERDGGVYEIGRGADAVECLAIWDRTPRPDERGAM